MKESISALARKHKVNRATLSNWRDQGLDLSDDQAIKIRVKGMRGATADSEDLQAAKLRKAIADATRAETQAAKEKGLLVEALGIRRQGEVVGRAIAAELERAEGDLPGQLGGRSSSEIAVMLSKRFREIRTNLSQITP